MAVSVLKVNATAFTGVRVEQYLVAQMSSGVLGFPPGM